MIKSLGVLISAAFLLSACTEAGNSYNGPDNSAQYQILHPGIGPGRAASMTAVAPNWALTNAHAGGMADGLAYNAPQADLALVHITNGKPLKFGTVKVGDRVTFYGTGSIGDRRIAYGNVVDTHAFVCWGKPLPTDKDNACLRAGYGVEYAMLISSNADSGYSGGPIINDKGELVGISAMKTADDPVGSLHPVNRDSTIFTVSKPTDNKLSNGKTVSDLAMHGAILTPTPITLHNAPYNTIVGYPIDAAMKEFFPNGDPSKTVLATALDAKPAGWISNHMEDIIIFLIVV